MGATLNMDHVSLAASAGWVQDPVVLQVGREGGVPTSLKHRLVPSDRAGQGRAGQGRAGQGRAGQGRDLA